MINADVRDILRLPWQLICFTLRHCVGQKCSVFWESRKSNLKILTIKNCPKMSCLIFAFDFCESLIENNEIIENLNICQKWQKYPRILENLTVSIKNVENTPEFLTETQKYGKKWSKMIKNDSENDQKFQKLYQNFWLLTENGRLLAFS